MQFAATCLVALAVVSAVIAEIHFEEKFQDASWEDNWVYSEHSGVEFGKFKLTAGKFYDDESNKGLQTSEDARFYAISRKFEPFSNRDKPFVLQFSVKHEQNIDCGGGYLKVFDCSVDQKNLHGETPYLMMFGPDICGPGTKRVHVIFNYKGENYLIEKEIRCKDDVFTHFYTLVVQPDNTYEVLIDGEKVESGNLEDDWKFLAPKKIKDPEAKKPEDWEDNATIPDPEDQKPEGYDDIKPTIPDPEASKPDDWDDDMDGEWEVPMVDNPEFKGEWKPKQIDNPKYKGEWQHPEIDNPEFVADTELYLRDEVCGVGLDLWQVKSGTIFGNILFTSDVEYAKEQALKAKAIQEGEKKMKDAQDEEERQKAEEEAKKAAPKDEDDEDEDDEEVKGEATPTEDHDEL